MYYVTYVAEKKHRIVTEVLNCVPISHFLDIFLYAMATGNRKGFFFAVYLVRKEISGKWLIGAQFIAIVLKWCMFSYVCYIVRVILLGGANG